MRIEDHHEGDVLVVRPAEPSLDAYAATGFREHMTERIQQGDHRIVLDLAAVDFIDSTGLGSIVTALKRLDGRGVMVICNAGDMVMDVFRLTRMDRVFPIVRTCEDALALARDPARAA